MSQGPLCFVLMPFGTKNDGNKEINFDTVYNSFIKPAIEQAGLTPIRADEEKTGGFIHKPMYERLMFCDFAVADLSFANANVFYELGIRHALKPHTTISIFEIGTRLPFDTAPLRTFPYSFEDGGVKNLNDQTAALAGSIRRNLTEAAEDSPIGQLVQGYRFPDLDYLKEHADSFADTIKAAADIKQNLQDLLKQWRVLEKAEKGVTQEQKAASDLKQQAIIDKVEAIKNDQITNLVYNYDLLYNLMDTYKGMSAFNELSGLLKFMVNGPFKNDVHILQQLALAYNKLKQRDDAKDILQKIIDQYGADAETNGLLGAVYKGFMDDSKDDDDLSEAYRNMAIETYLAGFDADPREYYPGVNALTLMFFSNNSDDRFDKYYPLVSYAVSRSAKQKDYWVQATGLELAALKMDEAAARKWLGAAIIATPEQWMKETTASNLRKICDTVKKGNAATDTAWLEEIIDKLT